MLAVKGAVDLVGGIRFLLVKLAIVGSVSLAGREDVYRRIQDAVEALEPAEVVSGGAEGVDTMAAEVAMMLGIPCVEFLPKRQAWLRGSPDGFQARNLKIAEYCDMLIRFAASDSRTYGSGWTKDRALERNHPAWTVTVHPDKPCPAPILGMP